jgi:DNA polymerase IV
VPVTAVCSIDEMACRLIGRERPLLAAIDLGMRVKRTSASAVGDAAQFGGPGDQPLSGQSGQRHGKARRPGGAAARHSARSAAQLTLRDLPGIGARTEKRLNEKGIHTMDELLALDCEQAGEIWGSVWGERLWHWLRGEDFDMAELEHQKSISHSHVLAPEMRTPEKAWAVAHKLLHKAAMRLRSRGLVGQQHRPGDWLRRAAQREHARLRFGVPTRGWRSEIKLSECQDNQTLIAALRRCGSRARGRAVRAPVLHRRALNNLVPDRLHTLALFDGLEEEQSRTRLLATMDQINDKYGMSTLAPPPCSPPTRPRPRASRFTAFRTGGDCGHARRAAGHGEEPFAARPEAAAGQGSCLRRRSPKRNSPRVLHTLTRSRWTKICWDSPPNS